MRDVSWSVKQEFVDSAHKALKDLLMAYAEMYEGEWGGGDWWEFDPEKGARPETHAAARQALRVLGLTWEEFRGKRRAGRK